MLVLGIDPGIGTTGCAIVKEEKGKFSLIHSEAITTSPSLSLPARLLKLHQSLVSLISRYLPDVAALETLFFGNNVTTAFSVGQARGVVLLALVQNNIPIAEYNPSQVKIAITGYGNSEKGQLSRMVKQILALPKTLTPDDVADAAAIALTHCFSHKINKFEERSTKFEINSNA